MIPRATVHPLRRVTAWSVLVHTLAAAGALWILLIVISLYWRFS